MTKSTKNTLARVLLVFGVVFAIGFAFAEHVSRAWEARSTVMIFPQPGNATAYGYGLVPAENARVLVSSAYFRGRLDDRLKQEGAWNNSYVLSAKILDGSALSIIVSGDLHDPIVLRDVSTVAVGELFASMAKYYDLSKEVAFKPLEVGEVRKQTATRESFAWAFASSMIAVALVEVVSRSLRGSGRGGRSAPGSASKDTRWWKENLKTKHESSSINVASDSKSELKKEDDTQKNEVTQRKKDKKIPTTTKQKEESRGLIEIHGTTSEHEDSHLISPGFHFAPKNRHPIAMVPTKKSASSAARQGAAPSNLPIVSVEDLDYLKPTMPDQKNVNTQESKVDTDADKKFDRGPERITPAEERAPDAEPTEDEMKERLNKLLRGEL